MALRKLMHELLDKRFKVVYTQPDPHAHAWAEKFLDLVYVQPGIEYDGADEETAEAPSIQRRKDDSVKFRKIYNLQFSHLQIHSLTIHFLLVLSWMTLT